MLEGDHTDSWSSSGAGPRAHEGRGESGVMRDGPRLSAKHLVRLLLGWIGLTSSQGAKDGSNNMRGDFGRYIIEVIGDGTAVGTEFGCLFLATLHYGFSKLDK